MYFAFFKCVNFRLIILSAPTDWVTKNVALCLVSGTKVLKAVDLYKSTLLVHN